MKRIITLVMALLLTLSVTTCGLAETAPEMITLRMFSNLPDRTSGKGLVEQTLVERFMQENPNIKVEVEALDDEAYKTKFKAYAAGSTMPDIMNVWGQPGFIDDLIEANLLGEYNMDDYADYDFLPGTMNGFMADGKLYGLPYSTDVMVFYYNKLMFQENGWEVPATFEELLSLADKAKAVGVSAVAMDGGDKWPLNIFITDVMEQLDGAGVMNKTHEAIANADFSDPTFIQAADMLYQAASAGLFQLGFETSDYATTMNLFTNAQAAMYYMGSWEMGMAANQDIPEELRNNIGVFTMPAVENGKGNATTIAAWNGSGYAYSSSSKHPLEAVQLINYMLLPDNWTRLTWECGACMSAQDFSKYSTGNETELQKSIMEILSASTDISGTPITDMGSSLFKTTIEDAAQELAIGAKTSQEYLDSLAAVCK